jgi:hypothetical protein
VALAGLALLAPAASSQAHVLAWHRGGGGRGGHVFIHGPRVFIGPGWGWGWGWGPGWGYWGPPPYVYGPYGPTVYDAPAEPPEYIEQQPAGYWYYCESQGDYYPRVPSCPEPWVKVPPTPQQ